MLLAGNQESVAHLQRNRELSFEAQVVCRAEPARGPSEATALAEPLIAVIVTGHGCGPRLGSPAAGQTDAPGRTACSPGRRPRSILDRTSRLAVLVSSMAMARKISESTSTSPVTRSVTSQLPS